jgi:hypothetical protein
MTLGGRGSGEKEEESSEEGGETRDGSVLFCSKICLVFCLKPQNKNKTLLCFVSYPICFVFVLFILKVFRFVLFYKNKQNKTF